MTPHPASFHTLFRLGSACLVPLIFLAEQAQRAQNADSTVAARAEANVQKLVVRTPANCSLVLNPRGGNNPPFRAAYGMPTSAEELGTNLECLLRGSVRTGRWGAMVVSLTRGDTIFARAEGLQFLPASTQKLLTSALALDQLGPDYHFQTNILRVGEVDSLGVLHGDLILRGGGDPAFSNKFLKGDAGSAVNVLAELVAGSGITRVTGNLVADPFAFESRLVPEGWLNRYLDAPYAAPVSALSLNENVASIVIAPGESEDAAPAMIDPPAATVNVNSTVRTIAGSRGSSIAVRKVDNLTIEVHGWIGDRAAPRRFTMVVDDPASFTAGAFRTALDMRGIRVGGKTLLDHTPSEAEVVAALPSPPMSQLITAMNRESINHYAELIFRNAGRGADELYPGSAAAAYARLADFLGTKVGADPSSVFSADGSGLSVLNRVTPRAMVQLLSHAHHAPWGQVFHASLPVAGESATLRSRMRNTPAQGNLHAKTGTTSEVISLAGYVTAENGEVLAFAFFYNGTERDRARSTIDQMGAAMAELVRK